MAMKSNLSAKEQLAVIKEKCDNLISEEDLFRKLEKSLKEKKPLKIKYGADPSAPDLHLGHTVVIQKLKAFQDLGHEVIFLIGDFTAMIGDPSGKSKTRKPLTREQVIENSKTYQSQIFKILDGKKTKIVYNSDWFGKMLFSQIIDIASRYTIARLLERDDFSKRYKNNIPITILELLYPLVQGYDSVVLNSDVEIGGSDQTFNMLVGRDLQREYGQEPQVTLSMPILEGTDGVQKMSKSLGNYIGISEPPKDIFGKVMSVSDELMYRYYQLLTDMSVKQVEELRNDVTEGKQHPKDVKKRLAHMITKRFSSGEEADKAAESFDSVFSKRENPEDIKDIYYSDSKVWIVQVLKDAQFVSSTSEAKRLISQGAVKIDSEKVTDDSAEIPVNGQILKCGKRQFARLVKK